MKKLLKYIEIAFRHVIVYPLLGLVLRNPVRNEIINLRSVRKLLILRDDGIGDIIISTPMFRKIKEAYPELKLSVFASLRNVDIIRHNPFIDKIFIVYRKPFALWKEIKRARAEQYDVVMNFVFNQTTSEGLLANFIAPNGLKIGQGLDKYKIFFNRLLKLDRSNKHMVEILATVVDEIFGTKFQNQSHVTEIFIDDQSKAKVDTFLYRKGLHRRGIEIDNYSYVVVNFSAVDVVRRMSITQTINIIETIIGMGKDVPVLIYPPNDRDKIQIIMELIKTIKVIVYPETGVATLLELASLIEGSRYTVTCDTSIVHFAAAGKTPVFVLYTPTAALNHEWMPYGVRNKCIFAKKGLGVDSIPLDHIRNELTDFALRLSNT